MMQKEFEKQLSQKIFKRRIIEGTISILLLVIGLVFLGLREASKEVIIHDGYLIIPAWEEINYNNAYLLPALVCILGAVWIGCFLLADLLCCRYRTVQKDLHHITIYRGMLHSLVYVNGTKKGQLEPFSGSQVVEVWLPNRIRITVSFNRTLFHLAHISFSDNTTSIEV